jgi:hypothetical protein
MTRRASFSSANSLSVRSSAAFVGSGIYSALNVGPYLLLGFVPSRHLPHLHVEFEGAWTSQTWESTRTQAIPLVGSLCWVHGNVRFCSGLATTILLSNRSSNNDDLHVTLGANFRIGTELFVRGPFSLRADVFGRLAFAYSNAPTPFAAGMAVMAAQSFD